MDFYQICVRESKEKDGIPEIYPDFIVGRSKDLMVRGKAFYAIWDEQKGLWSTDEYDVQRLVDEDLRKYAEEIRAKTGLSYTVKYLRSSTSGSWSRFRNYINLLSDNSHSLDSELTFANTDVKKTDYVSRRLPYSLSVGDHSAWDELVGTLYSVEEKAKIEWVIGAIVSGDSKKIQKFAVFYGPPGSGKGTVLEIVMKLFAGYTTTFDAKALGNPNKDFATEAFKSNPLVAVQGDGDLSKIEDNTRLNSIVSHEPMSMNEKFKPIFTDRIAAFCLLGTNKPVKITDAKSGIIRRLIDIHPTGVKIEINHYFTLMSRIDFELGAIAQHCLDVYQTMGKNHYEGYRPLEMMLQTDVFFNFIEAHFDIFKSQDGTTLKQAYALYKEWCSDTEIDHVLPQYKFREELRNYFDEFKDRTTIGGQVVRSYYEGFSANQFKVPAKQVDAFSLVLDETESLLDEVLADMPAQTWREDEDGALVPKWKWKNVKTTLKDIDTNELHFVKVPENHIVIDFDLTDEKTGEKSLERNLEAASVWPATYAELSKGGAGVHLHYLYEGDVSELAVRYSEGIEVKTLLGDASLRRRLSKCNSIPLASMKPGPLPYKEKTVLNENVIKSEKGLRDLIARNLRKEIHPDTKPSVDFIAKILNDAYASGLAYDVSDLKPRITAFANNSTNQPLQALKIVARMKFVSEGTEGAPLLEEEKSDAPLVIYDVEVYPNLFVICWKYRGSKTVVRMINPTPQQVEALFKYKLVGFYNRRYDNHILWAAFMGYSNAELFALSQRIIEKNDHNAMFGEAYGLSYADIWDFASIKKSLKKWQIDLGLPHVEMDIPWDKPVPEELIPKVVEYCVNDVETTEKVLDDREQDLVARKILAELSGLSINETNAKHMARMLFMGDRNAKDEFVYTDLSTEFPGYTFDPKRKINKSEYRGLDPSEGGYVYAEPGMYSNVAVLDVASMHPTSIEQLNLFGKYTQNFSALKAARLAIKHKDYDAAQVMLGGRLKPFLQKEEDAKALSDALKIVINSVYGLTAATFDNPFRHRKNVDNIVAKRGALFMIDLQHFVQERGFTVAHIKTDSIKIPDATPEIIDEVFEFGARYGYEFEHEATYEKFCLVNDAVYIAREGDKWEAVGAQFQHPYVFKKLFSREEITFDDLCETRQVQKGVMYLDFEFDKPMPLVEGMQFVGRAGRFVPVVEGSGGGVLYRVDSDGKMSAVTGTKGFLWVEASKADQETVDFSYFDAMVDEAVKTIEKFGPFETLLG